MAEKPNILILMPDQHRRDCLGCSSNSTIRTPHLDRMAREGVNFTSAYTTCPLCMPARASFISGLYPHNHGMWENAGNLPADDETFFHHLQQSGYRTAHIGKSHYYPHRPGEHCDDHKPYMQARGFDYVDETTGPWAASWTRSAITDEWEKRGLWKLYQEDYEKRRQFENTSHHTAQSVRVGNPLEEELMYKQTDRIAVWPSPLSDDEYLDSRVGDRAVRYIESYDRRQPLCLFVGFPGPHEPWDAPEPYASMYDPEKMPEALPVGEMGDWVPDRVKQRLEREQLAAKVPEEDIRRAAASYYGKISLIDAWIGRIMDAFDRLGGPENTLVVFWSDHGEMLGDHAGLFKQVFYESSMHVPLIVRWPSRIKPGRACSSLVQNIDIYPTVLEAAGAAPSERCFGRSLWPLLEDETQSIRPAVFSEISAFGHHNAAIRTQRHKYAVDETGEGFSLYDLQEDPQEQRNLVNHPESRQAEEELRRQLMAFFVGQQIRLRY